MLRYPESGLSSKKLAPLPIGVVLHRETAPECLQSQFLTLLTAVDSGYGLAYDAAAISPHMVETLARRIEALVWCRVQCPDASNPRTSNPARR